MDPKGKVAMLTGGARIGRSVAQALAGRGCALGLTYLGSRDAAEQTAESARALGVAAITCQADLRDETQAAAAVERIGKQLGRLDILINMASTYTHTPLDRLTARAWSDAVDSNAKSVFLLSLMAAPWMRREGAGRIVNFSDWTAASGRPRYEGYSPYFVAKAAVSGLTQTLALELAPDILVNAIAPGPIVAPADLPAEEAAKVIAATPLRRWGGAEEIARAVLFLVETEFVTGECLRVDGGRHLY